MSIPRPCASSDERDMQDTSSKEPRREQDTPVRSSETRNPIRPGGTPLGCAPAMGYSSWCGRSRASIHRPCSADEEQEEVEGEERGREGKREVVDWFFWYDCVCWAPQSAVDLIFIRWGWPYPSRS
jgi:hypothetical protein